MAITYKESSDDGYISYNTLTLLPSVHDYTTYDSKSCVSAYYYKGDGVSTGDIIHRTYKRYILGIDAGATVESAILYWYLAGRPFYSAAKACNLEQIDDYGALGWGDWAINVKNDYGTVMTWNEAAGWKYQDVTTEITAVQTDAYTAFRWRITTAPAVVGTAQQFMIGAYEENAYKSFMSITLTGWAGKIISVEEPNKFNGVANASIGYINGI